MKPTPQSLISDAKSRLESLPDTDYSGDKEIKDDLS